MARGLETSPGEKSPPDRLQGPPATSLPKGGGAIRGIGEKFAANPATGTGSLTIPLATSPGRSGFGPQLSLTYDSGSGNGPFGFGWNLSLPAITRRTDKRLPQYRDAEESDVYVLSGAEDLVPVLRPDGTRFEDATSFPGYVVRRYRPRTEGLFARIERWTDVATGEIHWRSITRDNITTWYGKDNNSRIFDPADSSPSFPTRTFSWLICESYDDKGNAIAFEYVPENSDNVDRGQANERNRVRTANRYLKRIKYGNRVSQLIQPDLTQAAWLFEVVFDYDEAHYEDIDLDPTLPEDAQHRFVRASASVGGAWAVRPDPFSSHRAGFEVRTYRRCRRVLMFHRIPDLPTGEKGYDGLVRSTEFDYADLDYTQPVTVNDELTHQGSTRFASFIRAAIQSGYVRDDSRPIVVRNGVAYATYLKKSLPPLEFQYSKAVIQNEILELDPTSLENLPAGLDGSTYQWADVDGVGIAGILTEQAGGALFFKPNLGEARLGSMQALPAKPSLGGLGTGRQQLLDLSSEGQLDLVSFTDRGFYERSPVGGWEPFKAFRQLPDIDWDNPSLRFVDFDGNGNADVMVPGHKVLTWYPSLAEEGFAPARIAFQPADEERGPSLILTDGSHAIFLRDMCGHGRPDLVFIGNGQVYYWPNEGYGKFGAKVTMDNAPWFDTPDQFDPSRIRLDDVDGTGANDVFYLGSSGAYIYFNQSGNRFSDAFHLPQFPVLDNVSSATTVDLLGNGTACLVWSSPLPAETRHLLRYIDLTGGVKPHLLTKAVNNLGAETHVLYAPSTQFYLDDQRNARPWVTRLPFPVHLVERVVTHDRISGNLFVTRYAYHHGYFDGIEREFRGFGMVEQWDTEELAALNVGGQLPAGTNIEASSHIPPVLTKTWFHTGVYLSRGHVSDFFAGLLNANDVGEYYREPGLTDAEARALLLDDTVLPSDLNVEEEREACRALKGFVLRQEVYALDGTNKEPHPYTVTEQNFTIRVLQRRESNRHGVFFAHARESISYHYERDPANPRIGQALTLEADDFGNVLKSAGIGYGRRQPDLSLSLADQAKQTQTLITYSENRVTNLVEAADDHRTPLPCESRTYELTGLVLPAGADRFTLEEILDAGRTATTLDYEEDPTVGRLEKRLIEHARTYYRGNDLNGPLPLGELQSLALPFETYKLAFTPGLLADVYGGRTSDTMLEDEGHYVHTEGDANWWLPSGRVFYSPDPIDTPPQELAYARQHFFLPHRYRDPFHTDAVSTESFVTYDTYDLLIQETRDALANRITVGERNVPPTQPLVRFGQNYRVLQPALVMDPNRNRSEVAFDALCMVIGTAVMGKPEEVPVRGDRLTATFHTDLTQAEIDEFLANPKGPIAATLLDDATTRIVYDLTGYWREPDPTRKKPVVAATLARETHASEPAPAEGPRIQVSVSYSDGFGREIQKKIQAEPGPVPQRDADGKVIVDASGQPIMTTGDSSPRWVGSGWTVFNNKGKPVRQYEPFFTDRHRFEFDVRIGVSPVLFYDPVSRLAATLHPNHTWEKVVFDPWRQAIWDVNDTVGVADPKTDADVDGFFSRLGNTEYLPTWLGLRTDAASAAAFAARYPNPNDRANQTQAAEKTRVHAATPTVAHADTLGRTFLTVAHNRFKYSDTPSADPPIEEFHSTRVILDIEGNQHEVFDAKDRVVMRYDYDMLSNLIHRASMDAGERWLLSDVAGKALYAWDSRGHRFRTTYDPLGRPTESLVMNGLSDEMVVAHRIYGEGVANPEAKNLRGKVFETRDQAGLTTNDRYDFKGNLIQGLRRLASTYNATLDWSGPVPLEAETYASRTRYDALNRPIQLIVPHSDQAGTTVNIIQRIFNEGNLLEQLHAWLNRNAEPAAWLDPATADLHVVTDIDYDAHGRRTLIDHGNGVRALFTYDRLTLRLTHLLTRRSPIAFPTDCPVVAPGGWPGCEVQNLHYTYDPTGNIIHTYDDAQQTIYFRNKRVEPSADYTYDAIYRLLEATGREHLGQSGGISSAPSPHSYNDAPRVGVLHPNDGNAMGRYMERFTYDTVGNLLEMQHRGNDPAHPGWTRIYAYNETNQLEPTKKNNRLTSTTIGGMIETFSAADDGYDPHGSLLRMPHLQIMEWDAWDQLQMTRRQAVNASDIEGLKRQGERTWYVYDSAGERIRKVTERTTGPITEGRIYIGNFELYRKNGTSPLVRETLHITDDEQRIALIETRTQGVEPGVPQRLIRYQFSDHQGSAKLELDDQAQILSYEEYSPYGSTCYQAMRNQTETLKRYRHTGKERDQETGLQYHGGRYYSPWLSRWVSSDPIGLADGVNVYRYVQNNPIRLTDSTGYQSSGTAEYGDIAPHSRQRRAIRGPGNIRLSEHEHIRARINLFIQTLDPQTGTSPVSQSAYRSMATLTIPRDMALIKTQYDLQLREQLRQGLQKGEISPQLIDDIQIEADIQRTVRAREEAIRARRAAGQSIGDLAEITDARITEAAHLQQSELFHRGRQQRSPISGATDAEIDDALRSLDEGTVPPRNVPTSRTGASAKAVEEAARTVGKSRAMLKQAVRWAGPLTTAAGIAVSAHAVAAASPKDRPRVVAEEAGAYVGGGAGFFGGAKAGALVGALGGPLGAAIGGVIGGLAGGYLGSEVGRAVGGGAYDAWQERGPTPRYLRTPEGMVIDTQSGRTWLGPGPKF